MPRAVWQARAVHRIRGCRSRGAGQRAAVPHDRSAPARSRRMHGLAMSACVSIATYTLSLWTPSLPATLPAAQ